MLHFQKSFTFIPLELLQIFIINIFSKHRPQRLPLDDKYKVFKESHNFKCGLYILFLFNQPATSIVVDDIFDGGICGYLSAISF